MTASFLNLKPADLNTLRMHPVSRDPMHHLACMAVANAYNKGDLTDHREVSALTGQLAEHLKKPEFPAHLDLTGCADVESLCKLTVLIGHARDLEPWQIGSMALPRCCTCIEADSDLGRAMSAVHPAMVVFETPGDIAEIDVRGVVADRLQFKTNPDRNGNLRVVRPRNCELDNRHEVVPHDASRTPRWTIAEHDLRGEQVHPAERVAAKDQIGARPPPLKIHPDAKAAARDAKYPVERCRHDQYRNVQRTLEGRTFPKGAPTAEKISAALKELFDQVGEIAGDDFARLAAVFVKTVTSAPDSRRAHVVNLQTGTKGRVEPDCSNTGLIANLDHPVHGRKDARIFDNPDVTRHFCELARKVSGQDVTGVRCHDEEAVLPPGVGHLLSHTRLATYVEVSARSGKLIDVRNLGRTFHDQIQVRDCDRCPPQLLFLVPPYAGITPQSDFPAGHKVSLAFTEDGERVRFKPSANKLALRWPNGLLQPAVRAKKSEPEANAPQDALASFRKITGLLHDKHQLLNIDTNRAWRDIQRYGKVDGSRPSGPLARFMDNVSGSAAKKLEEFQAFSKSLTGRDNVQTAELQRGCQLLIANWDSTSPDLARLFVLLSYDGQASIAGQTFRLRNYLVLPDGPPRVSSQPPEGKHSPPKAAEPHPRSGEFRDAAGTWWQKSVTGGDLRDLYAECTTQIHQQPEHREFMRWYELLTEWLPPDGKKASSEDAPEMLRVRLENACEQPKLSPWVRSECADASKRGAPIESMHRAAHALFWEVASRIESDEIEVGQPPWPAKA